MGVAMATLSQHVCEATLMNLANSFSQALYKMEKLP
jgi:hypothetical protein